MFKLQRVCSHIDTSWLCVPTCSWCLLTLKRCLQGCVLLIPVYCAEQIIFHPQHSAPGLLPFCLHSFSYSSVQFSHSVVSDSDPMDCSTPGPPVQHQLPESTQTHVHWVSDAIKPSHPLSSPSPPAFNLSQHQGLFRWVSSSHQVANVLEFQFQHKSFKWTHRTDFL